ncbi:F-box only protein 21 [Formica fusca]
MRRLGIHSTIATSNILQIFLKPTDVSKCPEYFCVERRNGQFYVENTIRGGDHDRNMLVDYILETKNNHYNVLKVVPLLIDFLKLESNLKKKEQVMLQQIMEREEEEVTDLIMWESNVNIKKSQPERRSARLKFIIGMVVNHTYNNYSRIHFGVIVGWHNYFNLDSVSGIEFDILPDNYSNISCGNVINCTDYMCLMHKPYYIIFCNNNEYCYVPQENISMCSSTKWIHHDEIGRYFSKYKYTYYVPNKMLARDYPYDAAIINEIMRNQ